MIPITVTLNIQLSVIKDYLTALLNHGVTAPDDDIDDIVQLVKTTKKEPAPPEQPQHSTIDVITSMPNEKFEEILSKVGFNETDAATARRLRDDVKAGKPLDLAAVTQLVTAYKQDNQLDLAQLASLFQSLQPQPKVEEKQPKVEEKPAAPAFDLNQMMSAFAPMLSNLTQQQRGGGRGKRHNKKR